MGWSGGFVEWTDNNTAYLSVVFSWQLSDAYQKAAWYKALGRRVMVGGPAVALNPGYFGDLAEENGVVDAIARHNPDATFTSRGCIRKCKFCAVPRLEGDLVELNDWTPRPIVCDNNFLACSRSHFDYVIDKLKPLKQIDFSQGLDSRLLTQYMADRLAELDLHVLRMAWDDTRYEKRFMTAFQKLLNAGIKPEIVRAYVLMGFNDTPEDALYRLETIRSLGAMPNPMRYQPLNAKVKNEYVGENWTDKQLKDMMRYYSRLSWLGYIPFEQYKLNTKKKTHNDNLPLFELGDEDVALSETD